MGDTEQWYTNKELFEMVNSLRSEMRETRETIKKYNGLREEVGSYQREVRDLKEQVDIMIAQKDERTTVWTSIRVWGGWILGIVSFIAAYWKIIIH